MTIEHLPDSADSPPSVIFESPEHRTVASYERELTRHRCTEVRLREALAREWSLVERIGGELRIGSTRFTVLFS
jgi:hypothetical protein